MWLLTRNGYFVGCLEASKISSNGFALDFFPLTVSPTGLKILGGGFVLLSDLASPWLPVILPFLKGWRAAVEINERWQHVSPSFWEMFDEKSFQKFVDMASFILGTRPNKKVNLQSLQITSWWTGRPWLKPPLKNVKRWHDTSPQTGISSSSETRQHGYFGFNNKNDSFIMIPNRLNLASMKDPDVLFFWLWSTTTHILLFRMNWVHFKRDTSFLPWNEMIKYW